MSRSANTERVRALTKAHNDQAKLLKEHELDVQNLRRAIQQLAGVAQSTAEQVQAISQLLEHLEMSGQCKFDLEAPPKCHEDMTDEEWLEAPLSPDELKAVELAEVGPVKEL